MSDELVELNLVEGKRSSRTFANELLDVIDRLLVLISDVAVGNESLKTTPEFRSELGEFRKLVADLDPEGGKSLQVLAESCLTACERFFSQAREHALNREIEFIEIIDVLRETVRTLAGQSAEFNDSLIASSRRFQGLLEINDIQVLKEQIKIEAQDLNRMVEERRRSDKESHSHLSGKIETLQNRLARAEEDALIDPLTQVANRGHFDDSIQKWIQKHRATEARFVVALLDLDDFKKINDTMGHQVGDRVLLGAAQILKNCVRSEDLVARYGGEEFAMLLDGISLDQAESKLSQLLAEIASTRYELRSGDPGGFVRFTTSCGLAEFTGSETVEQLVAAADGALYDAKKGGKNRVVVNRKKSILKGLFGKKRSAA